MTCPRHASDDHRLERLIRRLPEHRQESARWLRSPAARWVRVPLGLLFILGSFLFILPIFGLWMLPVGLLLLAEDVPRCAACAPASRLDRTSLAALVFRTPRRGEGGDNMKNFDDREKGL